MRACVCTVRHVCGLVQVLMMDDEKLMKPPDGHLMVRVVSEKDNHVFFIAVSWPGPCCSARARMSLHHGAHVCVCVLFVCV